MIQASVCDVGVSEKDYLPVLFVRSDVFLETPFVRCLSISSVISAQTDFLVCVQQHRHQQYL